MENQNKDLHTKENEFYNRLRYWLMFKLRRGEIDIAQGAKLARTVLAEDENLEEKIDTLLIDLEKQFPELEEVNYIEKQEVNKVINALTVQILIELIEQGHPEAAVEFNQQIQDAGVQTAEEFTQFKEKFYKSLK